MRSILAGNKLLCVLCLLSALPLGILPAHPLAAQTAIASLKTHFENPPDDTRPMMRWWWFGAAVAKPEILRELQQMKADGIGGAELAFVYPQVVDDPAKGLVNEPFLSSGMLENVAYAAQEARKLGLRIDVTLGSGWPYGGPATTLAEAATRIRTIEIALPPKAISVRPPPLQEGETFISAAIVNLLPKAPANCNFQPGTVCGNQSPAA